MITLQKSTGSLQGSNGQQSTSTDPQQATQTVPSAAATQIQRLQGATAKRLRDKATTLHADLTSDEPLPKANKTTPTLQLRPLQIGTPTPRTSSTKRQADTQLTPGGDSMDISSITITDTYDPLFNQTFVLTENITTSMFASLYTPTSVFPTINSVTTRKFEDIEVYSNFDIEEKQQELRATSPYIWYDSEYPKDALITGMNAEMDSMKEHCVYTEVLTSGLSAETIATAISTRWVHRWKGLVVKSRLCARGFTQVIEDADTIFASTPSLTTMKCLLTLALSLNWTITAGDVSTAFLHAPLEDDIYVTPPPEYYPQGGVLWKLKKAMYGLKNSPKLWQDHFASTLESLGYERMKTDPNLYHNTTTGSYVLAYVDDLLFLGPEATNNSAVKAIQSKLLLKVTGTLTPDTPINFLGRRITHNGDSIALQMDPTYIDKILEEHNMSNIKPATTTGTHTIKRPDDGDTPLSTEDHSLFRRSTGKILWLAHIRTDIQFATKELSRALSSPTNEDMAKLKHLLRYLAGTKNYALHLRPTLQLSSTNSSLDLDVYCDSDWAGCSKTRKSTSGVVVHLLGTTVFTCSRTQATVALSSGEAELYAIGLGIQEALYIKSLITEAKLAKLVNVTCHTDSTAGKSMATRYGLGKKTKHIDLRYLYMQDLVASGMLTLKKIGTDENVSDLLTKYLSAETTSKHATTLGNSDSGRNFIS